MPHSTAAGDEPAGRLAVFDEWRFPLEHLSYLAMLRLHLSLAYLFLALLALPSVGVPAFVQEPGQTITGEVVGVKDGDAIEVMHGGQAVTVRLHGVDTSETGQPFGNAAKQRASELVFGKVVRVAVEDIDRYGRTGGRVEIGGG